MKLSEGIKIRIEELINKNNISLTELCLNSNLTPSTLFDFMAGKSKYPSLPTLMKICAGTNISLEEFFARDYLKDYSEVYN